MKDEFVQQVKGVLEHLSQQNMELKKKFLPLLEKEIDLLQEEIDYLLRKLQWNSQTNKNNAYRAAVAFHGGRRFIYPKKKMGDFIYPRFTTVLHK